MSNFADHFSTQSGSYAEFRPVYPPSLFQWLSAQCTDHELAWDVATGNGQAAEALAPHFRSVYASDASAKQIAETKAHEKIRYAVEPADLSSLADKSCDLITVAQALHWFANDSFYNEVQRTIKPGGIFAAWGYGLHAVQPDIDDIVKKYYSYIVGKFWPPERMYVEHHYRDLPFPFAETPAPELAIEDNYSLEQMVGYLTSWSSTQRYIKERGENPLALIADDLSNAWGTAATRPIRWPLFFKVAKIKPTSDSLTAKV
jgi:SAM-dependent methyltransferase